MQPSNESQLQQLQMDEAATCHEQITDQVQ